MSFFGDSQASESLCRLATGTAGTGSILSARCGPRSSLALRAGGSRDRRSRLDWCIASRSLHGQVLCRDSLYCHVVPPLNGGAGSARTVAVGRADDGWRGTWAYTDATGVCFAAVGLALPLRRGEMQRCWLRG